MTNRYIFLGIALLTVLSVVDLRAQAPCEIPSESNEIAVDCYEEQSPSAINQKSSSRRRLLPGEVVTKGERSYRIWSTEDDPEVLRARRQESLIMPDIVPVIPLRQQYDSKPK